MTNTVARLILIVVFGFVGPTQTFAAGGVDSEVLNLVGGGRMEALSDGSKPQRLNNSSLSARIPISHFARLLLHFDPEMLDAPGKSAFGHGREETSTVEFAGALFPEEWIAEARAAKDAIERRALMQRWYARIKGMDMNPRTTIQLFWPVTLVPSRYDFATESFPVYGTRPFSIEKLSFGLGPRSANCVQLDRSFELPSVAIPQDEAEAFVFRNQNRVAKGNSASIYVGMRITIIGKNEIAPGDRHGCALTARVDSIKGFYYVGFDAQRFDASTAIPGEVFATWFERGAEPGTASTANVATPFHAQETPAAAAEEAQQFKLETRKGLVLLGPGQSPGQTPYSVDRLALANLKTYADFLFMGAAPELFTIPFRAKCVGNKYLPEGQRAAFFNSASGGQWLGNDEFEIRRNQQAFVDRGLPVILKRAVSPPRRFLVVAEMRMPEYDFAHNGFDFRSINNSTQTHGFGGVCSPASIHLGSGDYIDTFWSLPPADAETMLLSLPVDPRWPGANVRSVYVANEVEMAMLPAVQRIPGNLESAQVPVMTRLVSSTMYADKALSQVLFRPRIYKTRPTILEAGLPDSVTVSKSYEIEFGTQPDLLQTLKAKGDLTASEWSNLAYQQMMRDEAYTTEAQGQAHSPGAPLSLDEDYTPFFPWRYNATGGLYESLTPEQKTMFEQWSKMQAKTIP